ncbi:MAG: phosphate acyltransferase PlsX [Candidatus Zhuqueibacterota bacterium]
MPHNRIVIDAMGGDNAPLEIIHGAATACTENDDIYCLFVGREHDIKPLIINAKIPADRWEIVHASEIITMDDKPKESVNEKTDASINVAAQLIRDDKGDALVSAGNTGATILSCSKFIPRMPGIERGVLAAVLPSVRKKHGDPGISIMLDVGATLNCTVNQLVSFAFMGVQYAKEVINIEHPRVGLLNIGEEDTKGHEVLVETNRTLKHIKGIEFIGNIEGKDIMRGIADVIITEGLVGNIVLKTLEGVAEMSIKTGKRIWKKSLLSRLGMTMLAPVLKKLKKRMDYSEYGGAPILGFQKLVIKAHGRSKAKAIKNAILMADRSVRCHLIEHMEQSMKELYAQ